MGRLESMGQTLRRVGDRDRTQLLARQMERQVKYLQRRAKRELNTLGVYRPRESKRLSSEANCTDDIYIYIYY